MIDSYAVQRCEHVSQRSFETVVAAFEAESATLPSLPNLADWKAYEAALQALTLIPNLSRAEPAARFTEPRGIETAQNRTGPIKASGCHLGWLAAKRARPRMEDA
jgi:hypothetical protein